MQHRCWGWRSCHIPRCTRRAAAFAALTLRTAAQQNQGYEDQPVWRVGRQNPAECPEEAPRLPHRPDHPRSPTAALRCDAQRSRTLAHNRPQAALADSHPSRAACSVDKQPQCYCWRWASLVRAVPHHRPRRAGRLRRRRTRPKTSGCTGSACRQVERRRSGRCAAGARQTSRVRRAARSRREGPRGHLTLTLTLRRSRAHRACCRRRCPAVCTVVGLPLPTGPRGAPLSLRWCARKLPTYHCGYPVPPGTAPGAGTARGKGKSRCGWDPPRHRCGARIARGWRPGGCRGGLLATWRRCVKVRDGWAWLARARERSHRPRRCVRQGCAIQTAWAAGSGMGGRRG